MALEMRSEYGKEKAGGSCRSSTTAPRYLVTRSDNVIVPFDDNEGEDICADSAMLFERWFS